MLLYRKFFIHKKELIFLEFLLKKQFTKYFYTKLFIYKTINFSNYKILLVDNYLNEFTLKIKKKFRRLNFLIKKKSGSFLKGDLFIYKHSKLNFYYFISLGFKTYIKKKIYFTLNSLKFLIKNFNIVFIYKIIRGGFIGFSNKILGYISKNILVKSKEKIFKYKNYYLLQKITCVPFFSSNIKSFFFFSNGFIKNFRKSTNRKFFFKRFKFLFNFNSIFYKRFILYFIALFKNNNIQNFNNYFYNIFFKLYKFLLF
jgi:hypothetical protein